MKVVVNQVLRSGLKISGFEPGGEVIKTEPHSFGFHEGALLDKMNQIADVLESEEIVEKLNKDVL